MLNTTVAQEKFFAATDASAEVMGVARDAAWAFMREWVAA
jgi:hypothetical protein